MPRSLLLPIALMIAGAAAACAAPTRTNVVRYPNGELKWEVQTVANVPHGESRTYYPSGRVKTTGRYQRGKRDGEFAHFDEQGRLLRVELFIDGELKWSGASATDRPPKDLAAIALTEPDPEPDTEATQVYATLDRVTPSSQVGAQVAILRPAKLDDFNGGRYLELFGQAMRGRFGGYGAFTARSATAADDAILTGKSVLEIGGVYRFAALDHVLLGVAGVTLPVGNDDLDGFGASTATLSSRVGDAVLTLPRSAALRTSLSMVGAARFVFYRADAGLDLAFDISRVSDVVRMQDSHAALARLSLGAGFASQNVTLTGELVNVAVLTSGSSERMLHTLALSARLRRWRVEPYLAAVAPIASGDTVTAVAFILGARYSGRVQ